MKKYHYASVSLSSLLQLSAVPTPQDSFISDDTESRELNHLINAGYRLHSTHGESALFEREFEAPYNPLEVIRELFDDAEDQNGEGTCDCRPEPENDGHVCPMCKARTLLSRWEQHKDAAGNAVFVLRTK